MDLLEFINIILEVDSNSMEERFLVSLLWSSLVGAVLVLLKNSGVGLTEKNTFETH
jgi:hypothetical protein